jgi:O-succinylbenzoic acid--CoA ligase
MSETQSKRLTDWLHVASHLIGHVFILTSGSTAASEADYKWVALSKQAILAAATGSNSHLECTQDDVWLHCLPNFHVGGIGIWARALLADNKVVELDLSSGWDPHRFEAAARQSAATLASLVPTQVHDLITENLLAPKSLRAILVGGAALSDDTYIKACDLGWPILRTYGMSETASQVATESLDAPHERRMGGDTVYQVLPHLEAKQNSEGKICVKGLSVLTAYISLDTKGNPHLWDPKTEDGWVLTEDLGTVNGGRLRMLGRAKDRIKIGGELVNLAVLRETFEVHLPEALAADQFALLAVPDDRLESVIALVTEATVEDDAADAVVTSFNESVLPFERIRERYKLDAIPRSDLGKVKWAELSTLLPRR